MFFAYFVHIIALVGILGGILVLADCHRLRRKQRLRALDPLDAPVTRRQLLGEGLEAAGLRDDVVALRERLDRVEKQMDRVTLRVGQLLPAPAPPPAPPLRPPTLASPAAPPPAPPAPSFPKFQAGDWVRIWDAGASDLPKGKVVRVSGVANGACVTIEGYPFSGAAIDHGWNASRFHLVRHIDTREPVFKPGDHVRVIEPDPAWDLTQGAVHVVQHVNLTGSVHLDARRWANVAWAPTRFVLEEPVEAHTASL